MMATADYPDSPDPRDPERPGSARPVMGDHPEREDEPTPRADAGDAAPRRRDPLSPLVLAGVVALVLLLVVVILL